MEEKLNETKGFKDFVKSLLRNCASVTVTFTKADGSIRVMDCTLNRDVIPEDKLPKTVPAPDNEVGVPAEPPVETTCKVFETTTQEWRSFKWSSVLSVNFTL